MPRTLPGRTVIFTGAGGSFIGSGQVQVIRYRWESQGTCLLAPVVFADPGFRIDRCVMAAMLWNSTFLVSQGVFTTPGRCMVGRFMAGIQRNTACRLPFLFPHGVLGRPCSTVSCCPFRPPPRWCSRLCGMLDSSKTAYFPPHQIEVAASAELAPTPLSPVPVFLPLAWLTQP